jgi:hypothetical protein
MWTGGIPGNYVLIGGNTPNTYTSNAFLPNVNFACAEDAGIGTFTIPSYILFVVDSHAGRQSHDPADAPSVLQSSLDPGYGPTQNGSLPRYLIAPHQGVVPLKARLAKRIPVISRQKLASS